MEINPGKNFSRSVNFASIGSLAVIVTGKKGEQLGVGRQIGVLHMAKNDGRTFRRKVISIDDPKSPDGEVEIFDSECICRKLSDEDIDEIATQDKQLVSACDYVMSITSSSIELSSDPLTEPPA